VCDVFRELELGLVAAERLENVDQVRYSALDGRRRLAIVAKPLLHETELVQLLVESVGGAWMLWTFRVRS